MSDARKPTNDQLSALCAQMAAALAPFCCNPHTPPEGINPQQWAADTKRAYETMLNFHALSPDPVWQRVPEGCVVVPEKLTQEMALLIIPTRYIHDNGQGKFVAISIDQAWSETIAAANRARGEG